MLTSGSDPCHSHVGKNVPWGPESLSWPPNSERVWFQAAKQELKARYNNRFVAVRGKRVVGADSDLSALLTRFYQEYSADDSVYFGFVGEEPPATFG